MCVYVQFFLYKRNIVCFSPKEIENFNERSIDYIFSLKSHDYVVNINANRTSRRKGEQYIL